MKAKVLGLISLAVVALLILAGLCYFFYLKFETHPTGVSFLGKNAYLLVSPSTPPFFPVAKLDIANGSSTPIQIPAQGVAQMIGESKAASSSVAFYILSTPNFISSNLYKEDTAHPTAGLFQLTFSNTLKYDLSYDYLSGSAAYVSTTPPKSNTPHVEYYSPNTKKEVDLGKGSDPTVLAGGFFVVFKQGNSLVSENVMNQKTYTLLSVASSTVFAVDPESFKVALYNPSIQEVQIFSIGTKLSASFVSSTKVSSVPFELTFADGKLFMLSHPSASAHITRGISIQVVGNTAAPMYVSNIRSISTSMLVPNYRISIQHD